MNDDKDAIGAVGSMDTITISSTGWDSINDTIDMASIGNITLNSTGTGYSYTSSSVTVPSSSYLTTNGSYSTWAGSPSSLITSNTSSSTPSITVKGDAEFEGDIKVKGRNLSDVIDGIEKRLAILVPDPKKLEKYEALQKAYNHYKMLEALCMDEDNEQPT